MKQREYTEKQKLVLDVIAKLCPYIDKSYVKKEYINMLKKEYGIEPPYLTLREHVEYACCGAYHTFHFTLNDKQISINDWYDMLTDELCALYPLTNRFYVVEDKMKDNGGNCENYHCDHYLTLEPKED